MISGSNGSDGSDSFQWKRKRKLTPDDRFHFRRHNNVKLLTPVKPVRERVFGWILSIRCRIGLLKKEFVRKYWL